MMCIPVSQQVLLPFSIIQITRIKNVSSSIKFICNYLFFSQFNTYNRELVYISNIVFIVDRINGVK